MANGYALATGGFGVAFGIGGPGILNMATALASAAADRVPLLALSGEVPVAWEGRGGFQSASSPPLDDTAVMSGICSYSARVESPATLALHLRSALLTAVSSRSPAHLSIPLDIQQANVASRWTPLPQELRSPEFLDANAMDRVLSTVGLHRPHDRDFGRVRTPPQ